MHVNAPKLGLATGIVFAISWVICSALVVLLPGGTMQISGHMIHAELGAMDWTMTATGFVVGLIAWSVSAGLIAWAIGAVYNRLAA
ncbi:MAG: DUF5676 family membrane protein [Alphaproteobacteria bacterium]